MAKKTPGVGRVILAVTLLVMGITLLVDNTFGYNLWPRVWHLWPLLPIAFGLELLYRSYWLGRGRGEPERVAVDSAAVLVLTLLVLAGLVAGLVITPARQFTVSLRRGSGPDFFPSRRLFEGAVVRSFAERVEQLEGVREFELSNPRGTVRIRPSAAGEGIAVKVDIRRATRGPEPPAVPLDADLRLHRRPGTVTAEVVLPEVAGPGRGLFAECWVWVPAGLDVRLHNSFGEVEVIDLEGDVCILNRLGKTEVREIRGAVEVQTELGEARVAHVSGSVRCDNRFGSVTIEDVGSFIEASVSNGALEVVSQAGPQGDYRLTTNMGTLRLTIPRTANVTIEAVAQMGPINTNLPLRIERNGLSSRAEGVIGDGKVRIEMKTSMGGIDIRGR